jgi:Ca2+-binding EF-hand superfamily protein
MASKTRATAKLLNKAPTPGSADGPVREERKRSILAEDAKGIDRRTQTAFYATGAQQNVALAGMNARLQVRSGHDHPMAHAQTLPADPWPATLMLVFTFLQNLQYPLEAYNGQQVKPQSCKQNPDHLVVVLEGGPMNNVQLVVTKLQLKIGKAPAQQFRSKAARTDNKRAQRKPEKNIKLAVDQLSTSIRTAVHSAGKTIEQVFRSLDTNGNGSLEHQELVDGFKILGLELTESTMKPIWPLFDTDDDGEISLDEFLAFVMNKPVGGKYTMVGGCHY